MGWEIPGFLAKRLLINQNIDKNFLSIEKNLYKKRNYNFDNFINKLQKIKENYDPKKFCDEKRCFAFKHFPLL